MKYLFTNRANVVHEFSVLKDGNVLWEGDFSYYKVSYENNYDESYCALLNPDKKFLIIEKNPLISKEEFIKEIHNQNPLFEEIFKKRRELISLIKVEEKKYYHVDPDGGPFIMIGMNLGAIHNELEGVTIKKIEHFNNGFLLFTN